MVDSRNDETTNAIDRLNDNIERLTRTVEVSGNAAAATAQAIPSLVRAAGTGADLYYGTRRAGSFMGFARQRHMWDAMGMAARCGRG